MTQADGDLPRIRLIGEVRLDGPGTAPFGEREAAAARRLLTLLVLEANPLTLDHLAFRLFGAEDDKRPELASEIRKARSAIVRALERNGGLLTTVRPGETMLDQRLVARTDLLQLYAAEADGRWDEVEDLLAESNGADVLEGLSEFAFVFGEGTDEQLRFTRVIAEHRARVADIRERLSERRASGHNRLAAIGLGVGLLVVVALSALLISNGGGHGHNPERSILVVDNRVTNGMVMEEDRVPAMLSSRPDVYCGRGHCEIADTSRRTGQKYDAAVCQTTGVRTTNGNDGDPVDDHNPSLATSSRYYGVRLGDGTFGFISEVWIRADERGGLGLRRC